MNEKQRVRWIGYGVAILATALSVLLRLALFQFAGSRGPFITFFPAIILSAYIGGLRPGLLATLLGAVAVDYFFMEPRFSLGISVDQAESYALALFVLIGVALSVLGESWLGVKHRLAASERRYAVTLASIGDAVIATDTQARITFLNPAAEAITGWPTADAIGRPLADVFRVINEQTRQPVEDPAAKVLRLGTTVGLANHTALLRRDGREMPIDDCGAPIIDDRGSIAGVVLVFRDVSQRRKAEEAEAFRLSNERLELALHGSSVGVWDIEMRDGDMRQGQRHYVNFWEQLGYEGRPAGGTALDVAHPEDRERAEEAAIRYLAGQTTEYETETRLRHKDGSYRNILARGLAVRNAAGKPIRFMGVTIDISKLRLAEEELRRTTALFQAVADGTQDAVYIKDRDGRHLMFNAAASRMVGKPIQDVLGRDDTAIFDAESAHAVMAHDRRVIESGMAASEEHELTAGGVTRTYLASKAPYRDAQGNVIGLIGICHDITERKRIEEALRASEQRWRNLTEALPQLVWSAMPDGSCDYFSAQWTEHTGVSEPDLLGWRWLETLHPDDREPTRKFWLDSVAEHHSYDIEYRVRRRDGEYRWFKTRGVPIRDSNGAIIKWFGTGTDITDLRQTQEALRASELRWRNLTEALPQLVWSAMPDGSCDYFSAQWTEHTGVSEPDLLGWRWLETLHPDDREPTRKFWLDSVAEHHPYDIEYRVRRRDGEYRWFKTRGVPIRDSNGAIIKWFGTGTDITELRETQEALRQAKARLDLAVRGSNIAIWECNMPDGRIENSHLTYTNVWESMGYDAATGPTDFPSTSAILFHPIDRERVMREIQELFDSNRQDYESEFRVRWQDGSTRWHLSRGTVLRDPEGKPVRFIGTSADITALKRAEEAMRERERQLDSLMGHVPGLAYRALADDHWTALFVSRGIEDLSGYPADEFTSRRLNYADIMLPEDRPATREAVFTALRERRMYEVEHRIRHKDGSIRWIWARGHGVFAPDGSLRFIEGLNLDMTSQKQAEEALRESEERFRGTFENAAVGICHTHPTGQFLRVNETFCAILGYPREELLRKQFQDITHPDDLVASTELFAGMMRGDTPGYTIEKRYVRKDGSPIWAELFASLQRDAAGKPAYLIGVIQDTSERQRLDADLRQAKDAAEAANQAKDEFLANVSHEIRTPMNAILGMTELALDTELTEDQRHCLDTVKSAGDNLLIIINDLLDFTKIAAGKLELDLADFSLRTVVGDTLRTLAIRAHKKGLELIYDVNLNVPDGLVGDAGRLRQVLLNLVGNAIKFTDEGEVVVRVELDEAAEARHDEYVDLRFVVRDTGIGIPRDKHERVFRAFEQEDTSTTRKYGGTGLGLTIAARLAALMGGRITVESEPGVGSTFAFTANFGRQSRALRQPLAAAPDVLRDLAVMVVDDNATNRRICEKWLHDWQMKPTCVETGVAALEALSQHAAGRSPYELILLDAHMPDMDGYALAARIRKRAELSAARIVLLTSGDRVGDLARIHELQIDAHLLKPVTQERLLETIMQVMNRRDVKTPTWTGLARQGHEKPATAARSLSILAAEDNELNGQLLEQLLGRRGHHVRLVKNGREALATARDGEFDLLLLDVHMPEMDGFQVVRALREHERQTGRHLPVIALTARSRKEDRDQCLAAGMDDFLAKPIQAADLWAAIDRVGAQRPEFARSDPEFLSPNVLLAACGGDAIILENLCRVFKAGLPDLVAAARDSLRDGDAVRLREAAHNLCGIIGTFSTKAGSVASQVEDLATAARLEECRPLVDHLQQLSQDLLNRVDEMTIERLQNQIP